jgi:hypothetical protein
VQTAAAAALRFSIAGNTLAYGIWSLEQQMYVAWRAAPLLMNTASQVFDQDRRADREFVAGGFSWL